MDAVGVVASVLLGGLFVLAGASKIAAGAAWPRQARELGAPGFVVPAVPWIELAIGALLVVQVARAAVVVAALIVLAAFTALLTLRLAQGRRPACACFGAWSATPIGPVHIARNLAMMGLGLLALLA